jgi:hypothetical protein
MIENLPQVPFDPSACSEYTTRRPLTFRSSRITYYGPHACDNCGALICRMGFEFGGNRFDYPSGPIYPNTEWNPHVCDPKMVKSRPPASTLPPAPPPAAYPTMTDGEKQAFAKLRASFR